MRGPPDRVKGLTLDFYQTLVRSRGGVSRGQLYHRYLAEQGLTAQPWEHQVLYDVFEFYGEAYHPCLPTAQKKAFWIEFTRRLFLRTGVSDGSVERHAERIRDIFGSAHFELYPEVSDALENLRMRGLPLGIVSNWQKGLVHFCMELGILEYFQVVVCSAELGIQKPDPKMFETAVAGLGLRAEEVLHVGDTIEEDVEGARQAGVSCVWLDREGIGGVEPAIRDLREIERFLQ
ncbi:MAG: HAD family hydrolase [Kiritimatiellia bacterium]